MSEAMPEKTSTAMSRCIKINDWIFEVKMVRAIRVEEYGQPYSAIANINFTGDNVYIDGLMTNSTMEFSREDFNTLTAYLQQLGVKQIKFDRYKNQQAMLRSFDVSTLTTKSPPLKLVSAG